MRALVEPYLVNPGSAAAPHWMPGPSRGPEVYFPAPALAAIVIELARAGIDPHLHVDGDRAVRAGLDAIAALRERGARRFPALRRARRISGAVDAAGEARPRHDRPAARLPGTGSLEAGKFADLIVVDRDRRPAGLAKRPHQGRLRGLRQE